MSSELKQSIRGYTLAGTIGQGRYSRVYKGLQSGINREVALKMILPDFANHPDFIRRFEVNYRLVTRLNHRFIVPLYDYWREPEGAYLTMRCFPGNLNTLLTKGPFTLENAAQLIDQLTSALSVAHH